MKKIILLLIITFGLNGFSQSQTRKVLFLGNSYTYFNNLPEIVSDLATNTGDVLIYDSNLIGGYTLQDHFASTVSKNKILSNNWDYIALQEQSQRPAFEVPSAFMNGFSDLKTFIKQYKPCAQITSFMTWGHQNGDTQNCPTYPNVCTYIGMDNLLRDRYIDFSNVFESEVTPVGVVWRYIKENYPSINLYDPDGSHPTLAGSYLAACCFYTSIFRKNPTLITDNYGLDTTTASIIRNATKLLVFDQMLNWYIGKYVPISNFSYDIGAGSNQIVINNNTPTYRDTVIWDFGDGTTSTAMLPYHSYATDGNYTIRLTSNKCYLGQNLTSIFERTVNFCSHTNTILPSSLILCPNVSGTISTQTADSYQWLDDLGNPIPGATNQTLTVFTGNSRSVLTNINGCTERSTKILVDGYTDGPDGTSPCSLNTIGFDKPSEITIFPNPVQNELNFQTQVVIKDLDVYDIRGRKISVNQISNKSIDVSNLKQGIYFINVILENNKTFTSKFIKE